MLIVIGKVGYLLGIFSVAVGDGVIYELMWIVVVFCKDLLEINLIFNVGLIVGG